MFGFLRRGRDKGRLINELIESVRSRVRADVDGQSVTMRGGPFDGRVLRAHDVVDVRIAWLPPEQQRPAIARVAEWLCAGLPPAIDALWRSGRVYAPLPEDADAATIAAADVLLPRSGAPGKRLMLCLIRRRALIGMLPGLEPLLASEWLSLIYDSSTGEPDLVPALDPMREHFVPCALQHECRELPEAIGDVLEEREARLFEWMVGAFEMPEPGLKIGGWPCWLQPRPAPEAHGLVVQMPVGDLLDHVRLEDVYLFAREGRLVGEAQFT